MNVDSGVGLRSLCSFNQANHTLYIRISEGYTCTYIPYMFSKWSGPLIRPGHMTMFGKGFSAVHRGSGRVGIPHSLRIRIHGSNKTWLMHAARPHASTGRVTFLPRDEEGERWEGIGVRGRLDHLLPSFLPLSSRAEGTKVKMLLMTRPYCSPASAHTSNGFRGVADESHDKAEA